MLAVNKYPKDYVKRARARIERQVAAYRQLVAATSGRGKKDPKAEAALAAFEPEFFNAMVLVLEGSFTHRTRTLEGKDGNPLNEVRVLCTSILENDGTLQVEKSIKLKPDTSVLGLEPGDTIALNDDDFARLSRAFFDELERRFT